MNISLSKQVPSYLGLSYEQTLQQNVQFALNLVENTPLSPDNYEWQLLEQYVRGEVTLGQMITRLEAREPHT